MRKPKRRELRHALARTLVAGLLVVSGVFLPMGAVDPALAGPARIPGIAEAPHLVWGWGGADGSSGSSLHERHVRAVLHAAWKARGTPYVYGGSGPGGFDCSGFTRWAWGHGGHDLPHDAAAQYQAVPWHIRREQLKPGDLLFFYSPIQHVAIYWGHGKMMDAEHTGTRVHVHPVWWQYFTGAARPK